MDVDVVVASWEASNKKDELARAVLTISILLLSIFYYLWTFLKSRNRISAPLPPGPRDLPIVGYLPFSAQTCTNNLPN
ncbi:hypothetical protein C3L33_08636, partial [Rhododendron williamsianum]